MCFPTRAGSTPPKAIGHATFSPSTRERATLLPTHGDSQFASHGKLDGGAVKCAGLSMLGIVKCAAGVPRTALAPNVGRGLGSTTRAACTSRVILASTTRVLLQLARAAAGILAAATWVVLEVARAARVVSPALLASVVLLLARAAAGILVRRIANFLACAKGSRKLCPFFKSSLLTSSSLAFSCGCCGC